MSSSQTERNQMVKLKVVLLLFSAFISKSISSGIRPFPDCSSSSSNKWPHYSATLQWGKARREEKEKLSTQKCLECLLLSIGDMAVEMFKTDN